MNKRKWIIVAVLALTLISFGIFLAFHGKQENGTPVKQEVEKETKTETDLPEDELVNPDSEKKEPQEVEPENKTEQQAENEAPNQSGQETQSSSGSADVSETPNDKTEDSSLEGTEREPITLPEIELD